MAFTPVLSAVGGALIGASAALLFAVDGRIAGISVMVAGTVQPVLGDVRWRVLFLGGLVAAGVAVALFAPGTLGAPAGLPLWAMLVAGLAVGVGTTLGNGCTSGHGVCGIGRGSLRSIVATITFLATGALTVFVVRHVIGGGR